MWFNDPDTYGIYFLTGPKEDLGLLPPYAIPDPRTIEVRAVDRTVEYVADTITGVSHIGRHQRFYWIVSPKIFSATVLPKKEFPKTVTLENLAEFFESSGKKSGTIRLDDHTTLTRLDTHQFVLGGDEGKLVMWRANNILTWYPIGILTKNQLGTLKKYLGSVWTVVDHDGMVGLQNKEGKWYMASQQITFAIDGNVQSDERSAYVDQSLKVYTRLAKTINQYVDIITPSKLLTIAAGIKPTTHSILTRCDGCQSLNGLHLEVHMARGDVESFLIYAAYDAFSDKDALRSTWDLISDPTHLRVQEFKGIMHNFLLDTLRSKVSYGCFMPMERRRGSLSWQLFGDRKMVVDGVRLIEGRRNENEDGIRDGEWIANEGREVQRRRAFRGNDPVAIPRFRDRAFEDRAVAVLPGLEVPVAIPHEQDWQPEPFDMDLDLENDEE